VTLQSLIDLNYQLAINAALRSIMSAISS